MRYYKSSRPELVCIYDTGTRENHIPCVFAPSGNLATCQKVGIYHIVPGASQQAGINLQDIKQKKTHYKEVMREAHKSSR